MGFSAALAVERGWRALGSRFDTGFCDTHEIVSG